MAASSLHVASGAVAVGDGATGVGIGIAKGSTTAALGVARGAVSLGLGLARACVVAPAAVIGAGGPNCASEALWRADTAIAGAHVATTSALRRASANANDAMTKARTAAGGSMGRVRSLLQATAEQNGLHLRVVLGSDIAEVVLAAQRLIQEFGAPLFALPKKDLYSAARAWATLQWASRLLKKDPEAVDGQSSEAKLPLDSERWMRYSVATFGAYRAGKMLDDKNAELREKHRLRQEAFEKRAETRESVLSSLISSAAEVRDELGTTAPNRQERREAAAAAKRERRAVKAADKAARRAEKKKQKTIAQQGDSMDATEALPVEPSTAAEQATLNQDLNAEELLGEGLDVECLLIQALDYANDMLQSEQERDDAMLSDAEDTESQEPETLDSKVSNVSNRKIRREAAARERKMLKAEKALKNEALRTIRAQERQALANAKALRRQNLLEAKSKGNEVFRAAVEEWASPIGRAKQALVCAGLDPEGIEVVYFEDGNTPTSGEPHVPGQLVAVDHVKECVVVALRGSSCFRDALVDLDCKPEPLTLAGLRGLAHGGMLRAALKLAEPLAVVVEEALSKICVNSRRVIVTGHSLGAGVAALLTAMWHDDDKYLPATSVRCMAFACPQVLDMQLANGQASHTTSIVVGEDCVPCLSLATCTDLRDALVVLADDEAQGLGSAYSAAEIQADAEAENLQALADRYHAIRERVGTADFRLYPSGRLVKHLMGQKPRFVDHSAVDEMVVTADMVAGHMPRRYLASIVEITAIGGCSEDIWSEASTSLSSGIARALQELPSSVEGEAGPELARTGSQSTPCTADTAGRVQEHHEVEP